LNYTGLGLDVEAERHFRQAIARYGGTSSSPDDPRLDYGVFLMRQGRIQEALEPLHQAVSASPDSARANAELGRALLELNRPEAALGPLERSVNLDPKAWTARLLLGRVYFRLGRNEEGERETRLGREGWGKQGYGSSKVSNDRKRYYARSAVRRWAKQSLLMSPSSPVPFRRMPCGRSPSHSPRQWLPDSIAGAPRIQ
jgi:tetratricopeptide (TPR) repeat protein